MTENEIRELFKEHDVPLSRDDVWKVQSAHVIKHSALERLAVALSIRFDLPTMIRAERDECVVLVRGSRGDAMEWSFGEAAIELNYRVSGKQAGYPYAMAEKRAKDRVILKLAKLYGAYSEEEADAFRQAPQEVQQASKPEKATEADPFGLPPISEAKAYVSLAKTAMLNAQTGAELDDWWRSESGKRREYGVVSGTHEFDELAAAFKARKLELQKVAA